MTTSSALNPAQRSEDLARMADEVFDVLVVGGGVTGAGTALDAASRGLSTALVEQRDYASGTSSRSSKLFHGGIRYLERLNFGLVSEALAERNLMLKTICPHLAKPVSFVYPLKHPVWERLYVGAGTLIYDLMARRSGSPLPSREHLSRRELSKLAPGLDAEKTHGAVRYWDAQVDDARHTVLVARTARAHGAALASSARVTAIEPGADSVLATVRDLETGADATVAARAVVNATGVWSDDIGEMAGGGRLNVQASKGIHLVVPRQRITAGAGLILRTEASVLFVIPFGDHWIIGTTDTPWALRRAHPAASKCDIDYLLRWVSTVLTEPLRADDVVGVFAGLRPLLSGESDDTSKLSREHAVVDNGRRTVSVAGGKYTTYRVMARDAIDAAARYLEAPVPPSRTDKTPLIGAEPSREGDRLADRYGSLAADVRGLIERRPGLGERIAPDAPYTRAELVYAATHEGALHLDDFLTRRTRISIETRHRGADAAEEAARLVAPHLGWPDATIRRELRHYRARVEAERDSQRQPDDHTADAARMGAPDVRTGRAE